jgi:hypothetical protein
VWWGPVGYRWWAGGVTVVVGGVLNSDRWCDSNGRWCTY